MSQDNQIQLPTRAPNSLRSKTIGRLSILAGKQPKGGNDSSAKTQTWHRSTRDNPSPTSSSINAIPRPNLTWEPGRFPLDYIQRNLPLPRVVLCDHSNCDQGRGTLGFDCGQLMMLRTTCEVLRVQTVSLAVDVRDSKTLVETEDRLVVPEDYKGWFAVLGTSMTLKAIPHYRQVAQLAQSDCHTFLISGTENVISLKKVGESLSESRPLCPGDVLKMGTLDESGKYLHCTDDNDRDVLIPVVSQGTFYVLKNKSAPIKVPIVQIKDILQKYQFPCVVKLVYGREPSGEGVFTKMMVLDGVKQETSFLASTILKSRNTLHDLLLDIPNKFKLAVQSKELVLNPGYISALNLCQDKGDLFSRNMKIFRHVPGATERRVSAMGISFAAKTKPESSSLKGTGVSVAEKTVKPTSVNLPVTQASPAPSTGKPTQTASMSNQPSRKSLEATVAENAPNSKQSSSAKEIVQISSPTDKHEEKPTPISSTTSVKTKPKEEIKPPKQPQSTTITVNGSSSIQNGNSSIRLQNAGSHTQHRQRHAETDLPPPPPMITEIFVTGDRSSNNAPRKSDISRSASNDTLSQNGDNYPKERPHVEIVHLTQPEPAPSRPRAYEEMWTASSGKEDLANEELSSSSSSMSDSLTFGFGGQIVTGGVSGDSLKRNLSSPSPHPQSHAKGSLPETQMQNTGKGGQIVTGGVSVDSHKNYPSTSLPRTQVNLTESIPAIQTKVQKAGIGEQIVSGGVTEDPFKRNPTISTHSPQPSSNELLSEIRSKFQKVGNGGQIVTGGISEDPNERNHSKSSQPPQPNVKKSPPATQPKVQKDGFGGQIVTAGVFEDLTKTIPSPPPLPPHPQSLPPARPKLLTDHTQISPVQSPKASPQPYFNPNPFAKPSSQLQSQQQPPLQLQQQLHVVVQPKPQRNEKPQQEQNFESKIQAKATSLIQVKQSQQETVSPPKPPPSHQTKLQTVHLQNQSKPLEREEPVVNDSNKNVQKINVMTSHDKMKQAKNLLHHYSTIDIVEDVPEMAEEEPPPLPRDRRRESVYSEIEIVDDIPVIDDESSSGTDIEDLKASKKKKVSFSDILDVQTFPQQHVSTIDIHDDDNETSDNDYRDTKPKPGFSLDGWEVYTGRPSAQREVTPNFGEFNLAQRAYNPTGVNVEPDYMMPVLDRKGRVKSMHRGQNDPSQTPVDLAKRLSLPNMKVVDTRKPSKEYHRRDFEDDFLW